MRDPSQGVESYETGPVVELGMVRIGLSEEAARAEELRQKRRRGRRHCLQAGWLSRSGSVLKSGLALTWRKESLAWESLEL